MSTRRTILKTGAAAAVATTLGPRPATADRPDLQAALDRIVAAGASGALAEFRDGPSRWRGVSGVAELGTTRPVPRNGRFRIASVTKTFVATVVLQLVGEGRLLLDDTIDRWLPGAVPHTDRITVHQLLQHTSGVYDYTRRIAELYPDMEALLRHRYRHWSLDGLVALTAGQPLDFEPGTSSSYSNTGYILLAMIMERITGRPYAAEIARRILRPLGLRDTELPGDDPEIAGPHSHGYVPLDQDGRTVPVDITSFNMSLAASAGEMISTPADVNGFFRALLTGRLLPPALLERMLADPVDRYGLGIEQIQVSRDVTLWGKGGNFFGFDTMALTTADGLRQLSIMDHPWGDDDGQAVMDLIATAFPG